ncbi:glycosyl transferase family 2 [Natrialbaceae archaeon A-CW2]
MEYTQERIATLHQLTSGPVGFDGLEGILERTAIVVPMTDREQESPAAAGVLSALETLEPEPAAVIVPVRADSDTIEPFREWLESFSLPIHVRWCTAPAVDTLLGKHDLEGAYGKGRDVWLALGEAADEAEYVVVHDADATSFRADHIARLLAPLSMGYCFSKGYYARVEDGNLYGRLCRLFYEPMVRTLQDSHDDPLLSYLAAFRYALAGEFAMTAELARTLRPPRTWGLEVATLGDAYSFAGFDGTAQVDLGVHQHDHRPVSGSGGLESMSQEVARTLFAVIESSGVDIEYETLTSRYLSRAESLVEQYEADAIFNGLAYDPGDEQTQIQRYAAAITELFPSGTESRGERARLEAASHERLPAWRETPFGSDAVRAASTPWQAPLSEPTTQD